MKNNSVTFLFIFILIVSSSIAQESGLKNFPQLLLKSDLIMKAKVVNQEAKWVNDNRGKHIYTYATFQILEILKGYSPSNQVIFEISGGKIGDTSEVVSNSFSVKDGQEMILFSSKDNNISLSKILSKVNIIDEKVYLKNKYVPAENLITYLSDVIKNKIEPPQNLADAEIKIDELKFKNNSAPIGGVDSLQVIKKKNYVTTLDAVNLKPYKPTGWSAEIVTSIVTSTHLDAGAILETDNIYIDWAVANYGPADITATFIVRLYVDGITVADFSVPGLQYSYYSYIEDYNIGTLSAGSHTIKISADATSVIAESNEADNDFTKTITIQPVAGLPRITNISPSSASAGTNTSVTITGSNFGNTRGTNKVEFFYKDGEPKIEPSSYSSWSDTQIICVVPIGTINDYPASAGSGPVTVTTTNGTSAGYTFQITFSYGGVKWAGSTPVIHLRINENTNDLIGEGDEIVAAASSWNSAGSNFSFIYDGPTTNTTSTIDGINEIMWGTTSGSVATASYLFIGSNMIEADIVFNDSYNFSKDGSNFDVQTVALHELGHWLNLRDLYGNADASKIMYGFVSSGSIKRNLSIDEQNGIRWIYGSGTPSLPPSAITNSANGITTVSGTLNGIVNANGNSTVVTFEYGPTISYGNTITANQSPVNGSTNTTVSATINSLNPNTTYHFRVKGVSSVGTTYGSDQSFTTIVSAPIVTTNSASGITANSALLNGTVNANGVSTIVTFEYGTTTSYGNTIISNESPVSGSTNTNVTATINSLNPNTTYHFRVKGVSSGGTTYGSDQSFITTAGIPNATTNAASNITSNSAKLNGSINANDISTTVTFEYGTTTSYENTITAIESPVTGSTNTNVTATINSLSPNTTYHFRVKGVSSGGTTYGSDQSFTTNPIAPTVTTNSSSSITSNSALLNGTVNANGVSTIVSFEYGTTTSYENTIAAIESPVSGSTNTNVTATINSLSPNTTYHFRVKGVNSGGTTYGNDQSFATNAIAPLAISNSASNISNQSALLNGAVNANGVSTIVTFEFGLTTSYGNIITANESPVTGSTNINVTATINLLNPNTSYHFRVKAVSSAGATLGNDISFNTLSTSIRDNQNELIANFYLAQSYPNPFNPTTKIQFGLPKDVVVRLSVYNTLGQEIAVLVNLQLSRGAYSVDFDATELPNGIYFYKLQTGEFTQTKKMILLK